MEGSIYIARRQPPTQSYRPARSPNASAWREELAALPRWAVIAGGGLGAALMGMLVGAALAV